MDSTFCLANVINDSALASEASAASWSASLDSLVAFAELSVELAEAVPLVAEEAASCSFLTCYFSSSASF